MLNIRNVQVQRLLASKQSLNLMMDGMTVRNM